MTEDGDECSRNREGTLARRRFRQRDYWTRRQLEAHKRERENMHLLMLPLGDQPKGKKRGISILTNMSIDKEAKRILSKMRC